MKTLCMDAGFLIALYDESDNYHGSANDRFVEYVERTPNQLLVAWPILYETVSTRLVRNRRRMELFRRDWLRFERERRLALLDDRPLRFAALDDSLAELGRSARSYRALSLADRVVRALLADTKLRIDYFVTFNPGDFSDVCRKYRRVMV
jgi:predicted nucleic acid-binding protein